MSGVLPGTPPMQGGGGPNNPRRVPGPKTKTVYPKPLNVKGLQRHLKSVGYKIAIDGKMGPLTKSALADYLKVKKGKGIGPALAAAMKGTKITGRRDPKAWNKAQYPNSTSHITDSHDRSDAGKNNAVAPKGGNQGGAQTVSAPYVPPAMNPIAAGALPGGAQLIPDSYAGQLAAGYDPVINSLMQQQAAARRAAGNNAQEVRGWYDQVGEHLAKAGVRDRQINQAAQGSMQDATQAIMASLGGQANAGAGMVGAAGTEAVGTLKALGSAQEQYNQDMAPLLQGEGAGMAARVTAQGAKNAADLAARIAEVQGQKASARAEAMMNIQAMNNDIRNGRYDRAFQRMQYNDQLKQQAFNNNVTMTQLATAAIGLNAKLQGKTGPSKAYSWAKAPTTVREAAATQIQNAISVEGMTYPQAVAAARGIIRGYGWSMSNPAVVAFMQDLLRQAGFKVDPRTK